MEAYENLNYRKFTSKSEADKAINTLKGILLGIKLDDEVNDAELAELNLWCAKHYDLIDRNPFKEFMLAIREATSGSKDRIETVSDLYWLCQQYENDSYFYNVATADLQILQGICHGILADGIVTDQEVRALDEWLEGNAHLATYYPYDEIRSLVVSVLSDGKIDEIERKRLLAYFSEFVKLNEEELSKKLKGDTIDISINGICTVDPDIKFEGKNFCFTGVSKSFTRAEIEKQIKALGGQFQNNVIKSTNYLIVGDGGNPCWAFACYGRKVEDAVKLRKQGGQITLVHEFDFWDFVQDNR